MKIFPLIIIFILLIPNTYSQEFDYIIGYQRQHYNVVELGVAIAEREDGLKIYKNFHICGELLFGPSEPSLFGIKTGIDFTYVIFNFSGQASYYFNGNDKAFLLRPELGFSIFGFADLTYGYSVFIKRENLNMVNNVISFRFKIPFSLY
jgi:hypothetical protein